eukprot:CAMPEP_0179961160 /NCGR_PEP_ID=MMETSP0983-20121128/29532_1 /TAXON_ID=483367 /ORGANISM="non described non described, Strain CCMP 2436" /LENGTH=354 /DNA_ID=CAMNT_0021873571 /DNA_START=6 /DNA_END=1071 /DNA_ORIENTATION=-
MPMTMTAQEAQESVAHMTIRQLIRRCPKGVPMKEALDRQSRRKRKQPAASADGADFDEEEEAAARAAVRGPGPSGLGGALVPAGGDDAGGSRANARAGAEPEPEPDEAVFAPQVRIIDGRIVIDEESLEVTAGRLDNRLEEPSLVIEGNSSVTYGTYMNKTPSEKWQPEETETFFRALGQYGTDFSLIERILPHRTRRQIKLKFKREERENPRRVTESLTHRGPANTAELQMLVAGAEPTRRAAEQQRAAYRARGADDDGGGGSCRARGAGARAPAVCWQRCAHAAWAATDRALANGVPSSLAPPGGPALRAPLPTVEEERVIVEEDGDELPNANAQADEDDEEDDDDDFDVDY